MRQHLIAYACATVIAATATSFAQPLEADEPGTALAVQGLLSGYWVFPDEPALPPERVSDLCLQGLTIAESGQGWFSIVPVSDDSGSRLIADSQSVCEEGPKASLCQVETAESDGTWITERFLMEYDVDSDGHYWMRIHSLEQGWQRVSYPQRCSPADLRRLIVGQLSPITR